MPKFCLLVIIYKSASINKRCRFASRPLVGLFRWAATPCSILLGVAGFILFKIDRQFAWLRPQSLILMIFCLGDDHVNVRPHPDWKYWTIDFIASILALLDTMIFG